MTKAEYKAQYKRWYWKRNWWRILIHSLCWVFFEVFLILHLQLSLPGIIFTIPVIVIFYMMIHIPLTHTKERQKFEIRMMNPETDTWYKLVDFYVSESSEYTSEYSLEYTHSFHCSFISTEGVSFTNFWKERRSNTGSITLVEEWEKDIKEGWSWWERYEDNPSDYSGLKVVFCKVHRQDYVPPTPEEVSAYEKEHLTLRY